MTEQERTLASLGQGERAVISHVDTTDPQVRRLMTLGLVEGTEIEHATAAIGGDPIEFRLYGHGISLRREQALSFKIKSTGAGEDSR